MNAPLYTTDILRLAAGLPDPRRLDRIDGEASLRSPTCGSRITCQVTVDAHGRLTDMSQQVTACAFGQAAAALVAAHASGRDRSAVTAATADLRNWLEQRQEEPSGWPGIAALQPARSRVSRHAAILLPFDALAAALAAAEESRR